MHLPVFANKPRSWWREQAHALSHGSIVCLEVGAVGTSSFREKWKGVVLTGFSTIAGTLQLGHEPMDMLVSRRLGLCIASAVRVKATHRSIRGA